MRRPDRQTALAGKATARRAIVPRGAVASFTGILGLRMWQPGVRDAEQYSALAEEYRISLRLVRPDRGRVCDRAGMIVADDEPACRIALATQDTKLSYDEARLT